MSFRTVMIESPCRCSYQGGYMVVRKEDGASKVHLSEVSSIVLETQQVFLSAYLLSELAKAKISLVVSDERHNPVGQYLPLYGAHNTAKRIPLQLAWGEPIKKRVWQSIVRAKLKGQARVLSGYYKTIWTQFRGGGHHSVKRRTPFRVNRTPSQKSVPR